jgi:hypothetical protein
VNYLSEGRARARKPGLVRNGRELVEWIVGAIVLAVPWWVGMVELVRWIVL